MATQQTTSRAPAPRTRPVVRIVSTAAFRSLVLLRLCERVDRGALEMEEGRPIQLGPAGASLLGNEPSDAERRRCVLGPACWALVWTMLGAGLDDADASPPVGSRGRTASASVKRPL